MSGGMRQRVMIAAALACEPALLIADEPTTALDVTIQAQIMDLLSDLQAEFGMGVLFITHDLGVVAEQAHRVVVMYAGRLVERAGTGRLFSAAAHPYSAALLRCVPDEAESGDRLAVIEGSVPAPTALPSGCRFEPRCARAIGACRAAEPPLVVLGPDHAAACIRPLEAA
jgi:oligopeptide/dipeptide ABC transporter ATP-binding protein